MNTNSAVIKGIVKVLGKLNYYFEYSFIYKILAGIGSAVKGSWLVQDVAWPKDRDYGGGSLILRPFLYLSGAFMGLMKRLYGLITRANGTSLNKSLFNKAVMPLKHAEAVVSAVCLILSGLFLVLAAAGVGSIAMVAFGLAAILCAVLGILWADIFTLALRGCFPAKLIRWFFKEN